MNNQTARPKVWQHVIELLSHPAWNGLSCFFTALGTFGLGGIALAYILGLFRHAQDKLGWLLSPVEVPTVLLLGSVVVILAFMSTAIYRYFSIRGQRRKQVNNAPSPIAHATLFEPSDLDIEIMKQLAAAKETSQYWVEVAEIAAKHNLTKNRAKYFLRILEMHGFVHHHMIDGSWDVRDKGIDYLIEHQHI